MITYYFRSKKEEALVIQDNIRPGTWVHVEDPTTEELDVLVHTCELDRDLLTDALDLHEVPRTERSGDSTYFFTRFPYDGPNELETAPVLIAVTPTMVVTVTKVPPDFLRAYTAGKNELYTTQRAKLFLHLVEAINTAYRRELITIRREVQRSRVHLSRIHNKDIVQLVTLEQTLNGYVGALTPTFVALKTVLTSGQLDLHEDDKDLIEDIQLENQQIVESAKNNLKTIQNIRSSYTAIVTNNLNSVIKLLTSITIILTIPTILGSLYGMNVPLPFAESPYAFFGIALATVILMGAAAFVFSRRDWM